MRQETGGKDTRPTGLRFPLCELAHATPREGPRLVGRVFLSADGNVAGKENMPYWVRYAISHSIGSWIAPFHLQALAQPSLALTVLCRRKVKILAFQRPSGYHGRKDGNDVPSIGQSDWGQRGGTDEP